MTKRQKRNEYQGRSALKLMCETINRNPVRYATPVFENPILPGQPGYDSAEFESQVVLFGRERWSLDPEPARTAPSPDSINRPISEIAQERPIFGLIRDTQISEGQDSGQHSPTPHRGFTEAGNCSTERKTGQISLL